MTRKQSESPNAGNIFFKSLMDDKDTTQLLLDVEAKRPGAFDDLLVKVYPALKQMAHARLRDQRRDITLNTMDLVHEAYIKLVRYKEVNWKGRAHFFGAAARTMRRILTDHARAKSTKKRKGEEIGLTLAHAEAAVTIDQLIEIDDALKRLEEIRPRWVQVVECRYFAASVYKKLPNFLIYPTEQYRMIGAWHGRGCNAN